MVDAGAAASPGASLTQHREAIVSLKFVGSVALISLVVVYAVQHFEKSKA